ncbi:3028_t:CDS:2, partial [Paraglomus occultum]
MKKEEFIRLNKELIKNNSKLLANPRNAASGSLRTLVPLQNRNLHFFAYQLFFDNDRNSTYQSFNSQLECLQKLEELGFAVSPDYRSFTGIQEVKKFVEKQESKRDGLDFESDGVVIKVNDHSYYEKLEPVVLVGSRINKATLHNYAFIRNRALNIGDEVVIKKAGDVIPQ